jgi:tRNA-2-methylthio-N6-dimethylallyladenosine synthase
MGRGYSRERFLDVVARIRRAAPDSALNTDIIVGFPGETEGQFMNTLDLVTETQFDMVHVAAYSPRPGTPAAEWPDDIPAVEKERRRLAVEQAQEGISAARNAERMGHTLEILVDGKQRGRWRGRTTGNHLVFFESADDWLGNVARVRVTWSGPWSMIGYVCADTPDPVPTERLAR